MSGMFLPSLAQDAAAIEMVRQWIIALRSREYRQGVRWLHAIPEGQSEGEAFCCLGVICDLYAKRDPLVRWERLRWEKPGDRLPLGSEVIYEAVVDTEDERAVVKDDSELPGVVRDWLHLDSAIGHYAVQGATRNLAEDNDLGRSFTEIAKVIEQELEAVVT